MAATLPGPKKDLEEGPAITPPTKVPIRRRIGIAEGLARPVHDRIEVEVPDDDSPNHLRSLLSPN
jgi:hypothetical protein